MSNKSAPALGYYSMLTLHEVSAMYKFLGRYIFKKTPPDHR